MHILHFPVSFNSMSGRQSGQPYWLLKQVQKIAEFVLDAIYIILSLRSGWPPAGRLVNNQSINIVRWMHATKFIGSFYVIAQELADKIVSQ